MPHRSHHARGAATRGDDHADVFASTAEDLPKVARLLPHPDYFLHSEDEARALSELTDNRELAQFLLDRGAARVILTLGADGAFYRHRDRVVSTSPPFGST